MNDEQRPAEEQSNAPADQQPATTPPHSETPASTEPGASPQEQSTPANESSLEPADRSVHQAEPHPPEATEGDVPANSPAEGELPAALSEAAAETAANEPEPAASAEEPAANEPATPARDPLTAFSEAAAETAAGATPASETSPGKDEAESPSLMEEYEAQRAGQEQVKSELLSTVLAESPDTFAKRLEDVELQELVLLMEELAKGELNRELIRKVGQVKKKFDYLYRQVLAETAEAGPDNPAAMQRKATSLQLSNRFSAALGQFNKQKANYEKAREADKAANSEAKHALLEELRNIVHNEQFTKHKRVREIQDTWKEIGPVLPKDVDDVHRTYRALLDQFYALRKQYVELLDQDRKVNLETKQGFIQELRELIPADVEQTDLKFWNQQVEKVRELHARWKQTGPVPRDQSDLIWEIFKTATDEFYERRRQFFALRDEARQANVAAKEDLLAKLEPYKDFQSENIDDWRTASKEVKKLQDQWRQLGSVSGKEMAALNKRYRKILDSFYDRRSETFAELDKERDAIVKKKEELVAKAQAMSHSEDFPETAELMKQLQRAWKETGPDDYREAQKLQRKFRKANDQFFKRHKAWIAEQKAQEDDNLAKKDALVTRLKALTDTDQPAEQQAEAEAVMEEWLGLGLVPMKQRDKSEKQFLGAAEKFYQRALDDKEAAAAKLGELRTRLISQRPNSEAKLDRERKRLRGKLSNLQEKVKQYENNISFVAPGKKGDALRQDIQARIADVQQEIVKTKTELKGIDEQLKAAKEAQKAKQQEVEQRAKELMEKKASQRAEQAEGDQAEAPAAEAASAEANASAADETARPAADEPAGDAAQEAAPPASAPETRAAEETGAAPSAEPPAASDGASEEEVPPPDSSADDDADAPDASASPPAS